MFMILGLPRIFVFGALYYFSKSKDTKPKNMAFVFVKPHAVTPACNKTVKDALLAKGEKLSSFS